MSPDSILTIGGSKIQMGPFNDRIYLMSLDEDDLPGIVEEMISMAVHHDLSKIFAKLPRSKAEPFLSSGFVKEAEVTRMFGDEDGQFLSFYRYPWRREQADKTELDHVLSVANAKHGRRNVSSPSKIMQIRRLETRDAAEMASLYKQTFETYPFPITDPDFICQEMIDGVKFMGIFDGKTLIGAASAEISEDGFSAEMTDFAVIPQYRQRGIAGTLLQALETDCTKRGISCLFTIARSCSFGINSMFSKENYTYSGRLINNTNICGRLESMNVWHKYTQQNNRGINPF